MKPSKIDLIEALIAEHAQPWTSHCPDCRREEVLVDGLWYACGSCNPDTVAANDRLT